MNSKHILIAILILGAVLRFWGLGAQEFYHDEGLYAFRSIGYLDYLQNDDQSTPIQWFAGSDSMPFWTSFSFHDAPPLFFIVQNIFFRIFGESLFTARLPSVISGLLSIYLLYLISKKIFKKEIAVFFAPLLLSVSLVHVWISRSSLLESFQIFLVLLSIYYFFRLLEKPVLNSLKDYLLFGLTLGLNFLTKYTGVFLVLVYGLYFLFFRKEIYKRRELYFALALAAIMFLPVIVYNFYLYKITGHFDLQFSYLFSQETPEWRLSLGKLQDPFSEIFSNLQLMYSIPFLLIFSVSVLHLIYKIFRLRGAKDSRESGILVFWLLNFIFITLILVAAGSAFRFIALYAPVAAMIIALFLNDLFSRFSKEPFFKILAAVFIIYELFFVSDIFTSFPDFGIVKLGRYFNSEFRNFRSLAIPVSSNPHLNKIIKDNALRIPESGKSFLIVYDGNVGLSPRLWLFTRRNFYHGIPAFSVDQFKNFLKAGGTEQYKDYDIYFVKASGNTYLNPLLSNPTAGEFELFLKNELGLSPAKMIYGYDNLLMFTVYKFSL